MLYYYFLSFCYQSSDSPVQLFGNAELGLNSPITKHKDIAYIEGYVEKKWSIPCVRVLNYQLLRTEETE